MISPSPKDNMQRFFYLTTYDAISAEMAAALFPTNDWHVATDDYFVDACTLYNDTLDQQISDYQQRGFRGAIGDYSAFMLQHQLLAQKTAHPLCRAHLALDPKTRISFLLQHWSVLEKNPDLLAEKIVTNLRKLHLQPENILKLHKFDDYFAQLQDLALQQSFSLNDVDNRLFFYALLKTIMHDACDLANSTRIIRFEDLLEGKNSFPELYASLNTDDLKSKYMCAESMLWSEPCQRLFAACMQSSIKTIYYPHIEQSLSKIYQNLRYIEPPQQVRGDTRGLVAKPYSKLISIQLNSNRPAQLAQYFDNIEQTASVPGEIEVLVNIDTNDIKMESLLTAEMQCRPFTIKFIRTPRPASFCDLWQPINKLLMITDPQAYFLLNISDEMLFATKGWDDILRTYVGFFPDHLFRLRASRNKLRNYLDRWECSFAQDSIPITTKRWVECGGNWNPCFGPDSFQQLVHFYLTKNDSFSCTQSMRDVPIFDIALHGDVPALGINKTKLWKHNSEHIKAMQICQSHAMQQEANRRAMLIKAHIEAHKLNLTNYQVKDVPEKKSIHLLTLEDQPITEFPYRLSWLSITAVNCYRRLHFNHYFGGGKTDKRTFVLSFASYLKAKYWSVQIFYKGLLYAFYPLFLLKRQFKQNAS